MTSKAGEVSTSSLNKNDQSKVSCDSKVCIKPRFLAVVALSPVSDPGSIVVRVYFDGLKRPVCTSRFLPVRMGHTEVKANRAVN
jgi:hypothetical protein